MQNDRGRFRCYRYCFIGERHRCDGSAADNLRFPLFGTFFPDFSSARKNSDLRSESYQHETSHTYRQCGGPTWYLIQHCQLQFDPRDISLDLVDEIYIRWTAFCLHRLRPSKISPIVRMSSRSLWMFTATSVWKSGKNRERSLIAESTLRIATDG